MTKPTEADFDKVGERWIADAAETPPSMVPQVLYHYTDAAGLLGMLQSRRIWLTDYRFLNDRTEFVHIEKLVETLLAERGQQSGPDWRASFHAAILRWQKEDTPEDAFVFSCSQKRDDLSQWRGYASEGCGFTIGFTAESLSKVPNDAGGHSAFSRVIYRDDAQRLALGRALDELERIIVGADGLSPDETDAAIGEAARVFDWIATNRGALHKHRSFESEREWRLVRYVPRNSGRVKVRARGRSLVPYVEVGENDDLVIRSVGIGPGHINPAIVEAVRSLTRAHSNIAIYHADTPYRQN